MAIKKAESGTLHIDPLKQGRVTLRLIGSTPMFFNAMSAKAKRSLLLGGGKKTAAEKRELKHNPEEEFFDSTYRQATGPTLLCFPGSGPKAAMQTAALRTPGVAKTEVKQLVFMPQLRINIWGKPLLKMDVVRSADMNRTPDIRTRAYLPQWCTEVEVAFTTPQLSVHSIVSLMANAGKVCGLGDFRIEKGGSYGGFVVTGSEDMGDFQSDWDEITQQGRVIQQAALDNPEYADEETAELMAILEEERERRSPGLIAAE